MAIDEFLHELRDRLPPDAIVDGETLKRYEQATSAQERRILSAIRPGSIEDVRQIVLAARRHKVPLYPISRGKNWGLGSRLPVSQDNVVVDLSRMTDIEIDEKFGLARVAPGVTQHQLATHLANTGSRFFLDVTGSGAETSVVGNTLERGVAYNSLRAEMLQSLHVVLGTGEIIRTGYEHLPESRLAGLSRFGVGPDITGLFVQSNLGIVVGATIRLMPRPASLATFLISPKAADLPEFFETLQSLAREGTLHSIVHVANKRRSEITTTPLLYRALQATGRIPTRELAQEIVDRQLKGDWAAIGVIMGTRGRVLQSCWRIFRSLRRFGTVKFLTPGLVRRVQSVVSRILALWKLNVFLTGSGPFIGMTQGIPTNAALHSTYWPVSDHSPVEDDPDLGPGGIGFAAPVIPIDRASIAGLVAATERIGAAHAMRPAITLNLMNDRTLEGVVSIDFDRTDPARCAAARQCVRALNEAYVALGCTPYRLDVDNMDLIVRPDDPFWQTIRALKAVLDPDGILAPGRYCLD
jgi:4-cresol dehydrogenase (hydroxylating)